MEDIHTLFLLVSNFASGMAEWLFNNGYRS